MTVRPTRNQRQVTEAVARAGIVAVLRAAEPSHLPAVAETLAEEGVRILEVTMTTPGALDLLRRLCASFGEDVVVGAGTVLTADEAEACIDAGAEFVVSPAAAPDVVATARVAGVASYPGALSPSEILAAHRSGAAAVKLFPASAVGPRYVRDIHGPLPEVSLMPTGGIGVDDVADWLRAGSLAVGLGGSLLGRACEDGVDPGLRERARRAVHAVSSVREG